MEPYTFGFSEKIVNIVASGGKIWELHDRPGFCLHLNATLGCIIFIIIYFAVNLFLFLMSNYFNLMNSHLFV